MAAECCCSPLWHKEPLRVLRPHRDLLIPGSGEGRAHGVCEVLLETPPQPGVQGVVWDPTSLPLGPQGSCLGPLSAIAPGDASPHSTQDVQGQLLLLGLPTTFFMSHSQHPVPAPPHRSCQHTPHPQQEPQAGSYSCHVPAPTSTGRQGSRQTLNHPGTRTAPACRSVTAARPAS